MILQRILLTDQIQVLCTMSYSVSTVIHTKDDILQMILHIDNIHVSCTVLYSVNTVIHSKDDTSEDTAY